MFELAIETIVQLFRLCAKLFKSERCVLEIKRIFVPY
mgnify:CR=1 FL=1